MFVRPASDQSWQRMIDAGTLEQRAGTLGRATLGNWFQPGADPVSPVSEREAINDGREVPCESPVLERN